MNDGFRIYCAVVFGFGLIFGLCVLISFMPRSELRLKSDAQIVCELSHSAEVCFQALNR